MSFDSFGKSYSTNLQVTRDPKKSMLWNNIEPGDPYDIRKSMIARLPGETKNFMGDHIQLVCLFQAAEIQRLIDSLDEYKLKYKEVQKRDLDRHSYEVQIKELTEKASEGDKTRKETERLKDFIQKQSVELEEYRRRLSEVDSNLQTKYQKSLSQIQAMHKDNSQMKTQANAMKTEIQNWRAKFEALERSKNRQLEELRLSFENQKKSQFDREIRELKTRFEAERNQFDLDLRRLREGLEAKNRENNELGRQVNELTAKLRQLSIVEQKAADYEGKIGMATEEIERLNRVLRDRNNELNSTQASYTDMELNFQRITVEVTQLRKKYEVEFTQREEYERRTQELSRRVNDLQNSNKKIGEYENALALLSQERERLEMVAKSKVAESNEKQQIIQQLQYDNENFRRKTTSLQTRIKDVDEMTEKIFQYESRMSKLSSQAEQFNREREDMEKTRQDNELMRRKLNEFNQKINEYENKMEIITKEIQRLNNIVENKNKEIQNLNGLVQEGANAQRNLTKITEQLRKMTGENREMHGELREGQEKLRLSNAQQQKILNELNEYKEQLGQNSQQSENFKRRIQQLIAENSGLGEELHGAQQNLRLSAQQQQKLFNELNQVKEKFTENNAESETYRLKIQKLMNENNQLGDQVRNAQENLRLSASQIGKLNNELKITCNEYEELKRKFQEYGGDASKRISEYQGKVALLSQEIERLNGVIQRKNSEIKALGGEVQGAQENLRLSAAQASKLSSQLNQYRSQLQVNNQESETYRIKIQKLMSENNNLGDQVRNAQENLRLSASQIGKLNNELKIACNEIEALQRRLQQIGGDATKRISEYESKVALLSQQLERLNGVIEKKNSEIRALGGQVQQAQENLRLSAAQQTKLSSELNGYRSQLEVNNKESETFRQKIQKLLSENNNLGDQMRNAQQNLRLSASQIGKLTNELKITCNENEELQRRLQEFGTDATKRMSEYENKIALLSQQLERLNGVIERKNNEIRALGGEIQGAQENLRLSAAQTTKLSQELQDFKGKFQASNEESDTYRIKIQKLMNENNQLGDEVRNAQQNLRLSASQIGKLNNELKITCNENEELQRRLNDLGNVNQRLTETEKKLSVLSQQIERLNGVIEKKNIELGNLNKKLLEIESMNKTIGSLQERITKLVNENNSMEGQITTVQENLRLSANQNQKIIQQLQEYKRRINQNDQESQQFKQRIQKLLGENSALGDQVRESQQNLRLSAATMTKLKVQIEEYRNRINSNDQENNAIKMKMQKILSENVALGDEVRGAQENLRLSAATQAKLKSELDQFRNQLETNNKESDTYKQKIQKLLSENNSLGDEVRDAQENLRLSASQIGKLNNELKIACNEIEALQKRIQQIGGDATKRISDYENKIALLSQQLERLNGVIQRKNNEIRALGGEVQQAQENIRLSSAQASKMSQELHEYKSRFQATNEESETYRIKIQKLMNENNALGDEMRNAQENLRLSASQIGKLNNELKITCNENQELQRRLNELGNVNKKIPQYENKIAIMAQQIERLNSVLEKKNVELRGLTTRLSEIEGMNKTIGTLQERITKLVNENSSIEGQMTNAQENLRLSANQNQKIMQELQQYKKIIDQNDQESQQFKVKIQRLIGENTALGDEVKGAQENLRLSAATMAKLRSELEEYRSKITNNDQENNAIKMKMQKLLGENTALGDEVRGAQENLRLSAATQSKLKAQLDQFRNQMSQNNQESETYKQKIQKLLSENTSLGDEVRNAQENLRLSASQIGKIANELKITCNENEQLKKRLQEIGGDATRKISEYENKIAMLSQELERLNGVIERKNNEIRALGGEVQEAQENIRLSSAQQSKLSMELNQFRSQVEITNQESQTYRMKIQKLMSQNNNLGDEVRNAQENMRLSASQIGKLNNELKIACNEIEALQRRLQQVGDVNKKVGESDNKISILSQEVERLNGVIEKKNIELGNLTKKLSEIEVMNKTIGSLQEKIMRLVNENSSMQGEVQNAQQNLRLSANQNQKIIQELQQYKRRIDQNDQESQQFKIKIQKLMSENNNLGDEVRDAQQNLRLSAATMAKLKAQLDEYRGRISNNDQENNSIKMKMQKLIAENNSLGDEVRGAQQNLRLSAATQAKLKSELDQFRNQIQSNNRESETYKQKMQKLLSENNALGDEVRGAQENLRLSANTVSKLNNELKITCNENEDLKKRLQELGGDAGRKMSELQGKVALLSQELERLNVVIERKNNEIRALGGEIQEAQENFRLSNAQNSKVIQQLTQYKSQIQITNQESETYRIKIQKLMSENNNLGDQVRNAQENLRLSASQIGKLNNELKIACNEIEALQRRNQEMGNIGKVAAEYESKVAVFSSEIQRLNGVIEKKNAEIRYQNEQISEMENLSRQVKTLSDQLRRLSGQNQSLNGEVREGQEKLRLSANEANKLKTQLNDFRMSSDDMSRKLGQLNDTTKKVSEYESKIAMFSQEIERLNSVVEKKNTEVTNLKRNMQEISDMNQSIGSLQSKITRLVNENTSMEDDMRQAQENLRLSANQNAKMMKDISEYKKLIDQNNSENERIKQRMDKLVSENSNLGEELSSAQESLRLSSATQAKLARELHEYKERIGANNQQSETYKIRIQKLMSENTSLGEQVREAQDNLRLSANTVAKLNNEFKVVCNENEELKRRLEEESRYRKRSQQLEEKVILLSAEIQRLRATSGTSQSEYDGIMKKKQEYESKLAKVSAEFEKLNTIIQELRRENQSLKQTQYEFELSSRTNVHSEDKIKVLNEEIDRLTRLVEEKEEDLGELKLRFSDEAALVKRIQEHLSLFVILFAEIESLRKRVKDKEREVEDVRRSSLAPFRN